MHYNSNFEYPEFIARFIKRYLEDFNPSSVLDPFVNEGEFIKAVMTLDSVKHAVAITGENSKVSGLDLSHIKVLTKDPLSYLTETSEEFDAVVAPLPFGAKHHGEVPEGLGRIRGDYGDLLLLAASKRLSNQGSGLFLTTPSFMFASGKTARHALSEHGLYIDAALSVPAGSLSPYTGITTLLVIIKRQKPERLFVGELRDNEAQQDVLMDNLKRRREGKEPQLGALVKEDEFTTFDAYIAQKEMRKAAAKAQLKEIPIVELVEEINRPRLRDEEPFEDKPNNLYLPMIGTSNAVTSLDEATVKPQNLYQLVINPEVTSAAFLARFLNTSFGRKWRRSLEHGAFINRISFSTLKQKEIYLPLDGGLEKRLLETDTKITDAITRLSAMQQELWERPNAVKKIGKQLNSLVSLEGETFEAWVDTLPFPLASILWAYHAEQDVKERVAHLFHFFEALAVFTASFLISGFKNDANFYEAIKSTIEEKEERYQDWGRAASFGNWVVYAERLAKQLRRLLAEKERKEETLRNFGEPEPDFLTVLHDKEIFRALKDANELRDNWKGHGPSLTTLQSQGVLTRLESLLASVRQTISDCYENVELLSPISSRYSGGVFSYKVHALTGPKTPFRQITVKTLQPMEEGRLYLLQKDKLYPLRILPFVRLGPGPEQQPMTTYFYSRLTDNGARYVAYQFSSEPETFTNDQEVMEALSLILKS